MKKILFAALTVLLCMAAFVACNEETEEATQYKVTFLQQGQEAIVRYVNEGEDLTDIPEPQAKPGYTVTWDIQNFSNIMEDLTVNAVETPNKYTIHYDLGGQSGAQISAETSEVTYGAAYELLTPTCPGYTFTGWVLEDSEEPFTAGAAYNTVGDTHLVATWELNDKYVNPFL